MSNDDREFHALHKIAMQAALRDRLRLCETGKSYQLDPIERALVLQAFERLDRLEDDLVAAGDRVARRA
jgi:hypothetical protein